MADMEIKNAIIKSARIDTGDRGLLTAWLDLDYGGSGQGFGGYALYLPKSFSHHAVLSHAGHFLFRVMEIAGAERWDQIVGKTIRVKAQHCGVEAIGHLVKDDWFCPRDDFAAPDALREAVGPIAGCLTAFPYDPDEGDAEEVEITLTRKEVKTICALAGLDPVTGEPLAALQAEQGAK